MTWLVSLHPEVAKWTETLDDADYQRVLAALEALAVDGPALGRPFVDTVVGSRYPNMKELRPRGGALRLLFAFDPLRQAIVLTAGDKTNRWNEWYRENIPIADERFERHLDGVDESRQKTGKSRGRRGRR